MVSKIQKGLLQRSDDPLHLLLVIVLVAPHLQQPIDVLDVDDGGIEAVGVFDFVNQLLVAHEVFAVHFHEAVFKILRQLVNETRKSDSFRNFKQNNLFFRLELNQIHERFAQTLVSWHGE